MTKKDKISDPKPKTDFMPALVFAALSLIALYYGNLSGLNSLAALGSVTLYSSLCLFNKRSAWGIALVVVPGCWLMALPLPFAIKLSFFTLGFLTNRYMKEPMAPISMLVMLWLAYFAAHNILRQQLGLSLLSFDRPHAYTIAIEAIGVTFISFVPLLRLIPGFRSSMFSAMSMTSFAIHTSTFLLMLLCTTLITSLWLVFDIPLENIEARLLEDNTRLALLAFTLFAIASSFGLILSSHFTRFVEHIEKMANPAGKPFRPSSAIQTIQELQSATSNLQQAMNQGAEVARSKQSSINQLKKEMSIQEKLINEREISANNLTRLMNAAPWGSLACSGSGKIIVANETFCELFDLDINAIRGTHFNDIDRSSKWRKELVELLTWVCKELHTYTPERRISHNLSTIDQWYLQCEVRFTKSASRLENSKSSESFVYDDLAINLFVLKTQDTRALQIGFLSPSPLEIMGTETNQLAQSIQQQLSELAKRIRELEENLEKLQHEVDIPIRQTDPGLGLATGLKDLDSSVRAMANELRKVTSSSKSKDEERQALNLSTLLPLYYSYLSRVLDLEEPLKVYTHESKDGSANLVVNLRPEEALSLFSYLLFLVKNIIPRGPDMSISLGAEEITSQTANFIPGAIPGSYARISITHAGQSIEPQMKRLEAPLHGTDSPIQVALALLNMHISKLGGFISIQSSPTKGTNVTTYLPINPKGIEETVNQRRATSIHRRDEILGTNKDQTPTIMLIADSVEESETLLRMFSNLGHKTTSRTMSQVTENSSDHSMIFGGSGFEESSNGLEDSSSSLLDASDKAEIAQELSECDAAIILESQFEESTLRLLTALKSLHPSLALLVIADARNTQKFDRLATSVLTHPFTADELESALQEAIICN